MHDWDVFNEWSWDNSIFDDSNAIVIWVCNVDGVLAIWELGSEPGWFREKTCLAVFKAMGGASVKSVDLIVIENCLDFMVIGVGNKKHVFFGEEVDSKGMLKFCEGWVAIFVSECEKISWVVTSTYNYSYRVEII